LFIAMCLCFGATVTSPGRADEVVPPSENDVRCIVAIIKSSSIIDAKAPGSSQVALLYFLGKVDGRDPNLDLEAAIRSEIPKMTTEDIGLEDIRCGKELTERGQSLVTIGEDLKRDGL
jgi:hypothetical protein